MSHVPEDYNRHRLHKTWGEKHPPGDKAKAAQRRRRAQKHRNRLPGHFGKANWKVYQHYELYNMIMKAKPEQMYARAEQWKALAGAIEETTSKVQGTMQQVLGVWQGAASVSAGASTTRLMQWAGEASHTASTVAAKMSDYTDAVQRAQRHMPPPAFSTSEQRFRDGYTVMTTGGPADAVMLKALTTDAIVGHQEARARKAEAVAVMEVYEEDSRSVHHQIPHFESTDATTTSQPAWTPPAGPGGAAGAGGGSGAGVTAFPPAGSGAVSSPSGGSTSAQGFVDPLGLGGFGPGGGSGPNSLTGFGGGPGSLNGGADALRGGAGFPGGAGGAGAAAEMGAGALAGRGPGGAIGAGPAGVVPGAGARGGVGAFGGMPVGAGAHGEEDGEHTNKYDEGLDLFDDLPPAYPPVFGA